MSNAELDELVRLYNRAQDKTQELAFCVSKTPLHFRTCALALKAGKSVSVKDVEYQGRLLKSRASDALRAIAELHEYAATVFPDQERGAA